MGALIPRPGPYELISMHPLCVWNRLPNKGLLRIHIIRAVVRVLGVVSYNERLSF